MAELTMIEKSVTRVDALEKVTGQARFCTDLKSPGMIYGKILRSPYPHAKIVAVDISKAEKLPGVRAIVTGKDAPNVRSGIVLRDRPVLAKDRVRFVGDPVAAVAANSLAVAGEALDLIEVQYEELPAVFDPEESLKFDVPAVLHPDFASYEGAVIKPADAPPNVHSLHKIRKGNVEEGFRESDVVVEECYRAAMIQHCPLEPHGVLAQVEADGSLNVWVSSQGVHASRYHLSRIFGIPLAKVRVIAPYLGGGFGAKIHANVELIAALLTLKTRRPVKITFDREEEFVDGTVRIPTIVYIKDGARRDGTLLAREMKVILDSGAYGAVASLLTYVGSHGAVGSYQIKNFKWDSYGVYTNRPPAGTFRGVTNPTVEWAIECQMDILAEKLGLDPVAFRKKNILKEGEPNIIGEITFSIGAEECLDKITEYIALDKKQDESSGPWKIGRGIALGNMYSTAAGIACSAGVIVQPDSTIEVYSSAVEMGQGCRTVLSQIAAEEFQVPLDKVRIVSSDTALTPFSYPTVSSSTTYQAGKALRLACQDAKRQLFDVAAAKLGVSPDRLETKGGNIYMKDDAEKSIRISDLFAVVPTGTYLPKEVEIRGKGIAAPVMAPVDPETGQIPPELASKGAKRVTHRTHMAQAAEVAVDVATGEVRVLKFAGVYDTRPVNPQLCEGQMEGGAMMGIGSALLESMIFRGGTVVNLNFTDYKLVTAGDMPSNDNINFATVPAAGGGGPYDGVKGLGEAVMVPTAAMIANAVHDAVGIRISEIPITPASILKALKEAGST